ncbi:MAG: cation-transporting P-type ATPase [Clostridium sp.]|uniref:P-type ATPase n=1 Tax=Clostridium sp. TaxID=1506 RepID=UPI003F304474
MVRPHNNTGIDVVKEFQSSKEKGLTFIESEKRKKRYGSNNISFEKENFRILKKIIKKENIFILINLIIGITLFYYKWYLEGIIVEIVFLVNIGIELLEIYKYNKRLKYIEKINEAKVSIIRDGKEVIVQSREIVIGDIVNFKKGSLIPADIRILECENLKVSEKNVTGEEFIKEKFDYKLDSNTLTIGEISNMLFKGSIVKEGFGIGIVVKTGDKTYLGSILNSFYQQKEEKSFVDEYGGIVSKWSLLAFSINLIVYMFLGEKEIFLVNNFLVGGLSTLSFIYLKLRLFKSFFEKKNIKINNIDIVKKIKDIEIIFLEKNGGITKEEVKIKKIFTNFKVLKKEEVNYKEWNLKKIIDIGVIANKGYINEKEIKGTAIEKEYLRFAKGFGVEKESFKNREIFNLEMESDKRFFSVLSKGKKGYRLTSRGNTDHILDRCTHILIEGTVKELNNENKEMIKKYNYNFFTEGLVTEGIAYRTFNYKPSERENVESNLIFVGIVGFLNELYEDSKERIEFLKSNNIVPILFTEDTKISSTFSGIKTGIIKSKDEVITGAEIESLDEEEFIKVLKKIKVFSRISLVSKRRIIEMFKKENYKIISIGETIGDAGILKLSDIGIAKSNEMKLIEEISDISIEENYLEGFISFMKISKEEKEKLDKGLKDIIKYSSMILVFLSIVIFVFNLEIHILLKIGILIFMYIGEYFKYRY